MANLWCVIYSYLIMAFICMDYNPVHWNDFERIMMIGIAFIWVMLLRIYKH